MKEILKRVTMGAAVVGIALAAVGEGAALGAPWVLSGGPARAIDKLSAFQTCSCLRPYIALKGTALVDLLPLRRGEKRPPMPEPLDPSQAQLPTLDRVRAMIEGALAHDLPDVPKCGGTEDYNTMAWVNVEVWTVRHGGVVGWHVGLRAETEAYDDVFETAGMGIAAPGQVASDVASSIAGQSAAFTDAWRVSRGEERDIPPREPSGARPRIVPIVRPAPAR